MSNTLFLYIKITHICFVIFWMAGLLYLPRLFVYHTQTQIGSESYNMLLTMERKLLKIIMMPSMIVVLITGLGLFFHLGGFHGHLFSQIKLALNFVMIGFHFFFIKCYKNFLNGSNKKTKKFFLFINEMPGLIAIAMVSLVILKTVY